MEVLMPIDDILPRTGNEIVDVLFLNKTANDPIIELTGNKMNEWFNRYLKW